MNYILMVGYTVLTILVFVVGIKLSHKMKLAILNPFIISLLLLSGFLLLTKVSYANYYQGNAILNKLLQVSVVALAYPFYEQFSQIRRFWKSIVIVLLFASAFSMVTGAIFSLLLGADKVILASVLPKSVTTPIAVAISSEINGIPSVTAVGVTVAGIIGSVFGVTILKWSKVKNPKAMGLGMGAASHALGTASALNESAKMGSYAAISLVLCGIITSFLSPLVISILFFMSNR